MKTVKIKDGWHITDNVSALKIRSKNGKYLSRIHIEHTGKKPICDNRDFYFKLETGKFDGTGSDINQ